MSRTWRGHAKEERGISEGEIDTQPAIQEEPQEYSLQAPHMLPSGCSTLSKAHGLPVRFKGQRDFIVDKSFGRLTD